MDTTINGNAVINGDARAQRVVIIDTNGNVVYDVTDRFAALEARVAALEPPA